MSALDRLQKNAILGVASANPAKVAKVDTKTPETLAELATLALANSQTSKIDDNQPMPENQVPESDPKAAALATGTMWRPDNPFFLRSTIYDANMDEIYEAYWRAVYYYGTIPSITPAAAMRRAADDCHKARELRKAGRQYQLFPHQERRTS